MIYVHIGICDTATVVGPGLPDARPDYIDIRLMISAWREFIPKDDLARDLQLGLIVQRWDALLRADYTFTVARFAGSQPLFANNPPGDVRAN